MGLVETLTDRADFFAGWLVLVVCEAESAAAANVIEARQRTKREFMVF
jgi:hypothetical protein